MSPSSFAQTVLFLLIDRKCPVFFFVFFFACLFGGGGFLSVNCLSINYLLIYFGAV